MKEMIAVRPNGRYEILKANEERLRSFLAWYARIPSDAKSENWVQLSGALHVAAGRHAGVKRKGSGIRGATMAAVAAVSLSACAPYSQWEPTITALPQPQVQPIPQAQAVPVPRQLPPGGKASKHRARPKAQAFYQQPQQQQPVYAEPEAYPVQQGVNVDADRYRCRQAAQSAAGGEGEVAKNTLVGGLVGAAAGAAIGAAVGNPEAGTKIGAAVGGAGSGVYNGVGRSQHYQLAYANCLRGLGYQVAPVSSNDNPN